MSIAVKNNLIYNLVMILMAMENIIISIVCSIGGVLALIVIILVLEKFVFFKNRCKKELREIGNKYEYLHGLLKGEISQNIAKLEFISRTNLFYCEIHASFSKKYKEIKDNLDTQAKEIKDELNDLYYGKQYKEFKKRYKECLPLINEFSDKTDELSKELIDKLKPEEDARQRILELKERFREVKSLYNNNENELSYINDSFQKVFDKIETNFKQFESLLDSAKYEEANALLPNIEKVLEELIKLINITPKYIKEVNEILPNEIDNLLREYKELILQGLPLKTFDIEGVIENINHQIESIKVDLRSLHMTRIEKKIENIHIQLQEVKDSFVEEKTSKKQYEENSVKINTKFRQLSKEFIKISGSIEKIEKIYLIDEGHKALFNEIRDTLEDVNRDKSKLELYVHQIESLPYKVLVSKMNELAKGTNNLEKRIVEFKEYTNSLKNDSERAYNSIDGIYIKLKKYESNLKDLGSDDLYNLYSENFLTSYQYLDKIHGLLSKVPLDVTSINELMNKLETLTSSIYKDIDDLLMYKEKAINAILIGNKERNKFADVNTLLDQAEELYFKYNFKEAFNYSTKALEKINYRDGGFTN